MKKKFVRNTIGFTIIVLLLGLLFNGSDSFQTSLQQAKAKTHPSAESILASLTPKQLNSLHKLDVKQASGLQLDPDVDTSSEKEISVIVQFKQQPQSVAVVHAKLKGKSLSASQAKDKVAQSHESFKKDLAAIFKEDRKRRTTTFKIKNEYKHAFNGVAMTLPANKVKKLLKSDVVQAVWSNGTVKLDDPKPNDKAMDSSVSSSEGMSESNSFLGIDKLHEEGFTGKGVKVGVLDTGVDYNHPDIKGAYKGGYDFVDNDNDPMETTYEDWRKSGRPEKSGGNTYYTYHGTHVSGTIVGQHKNDSKYKTMGIAPDADLYVYRVLGPYGTAPFSQIIAGIDKAVADKMDVINLSLGASVNDPLSPSGIAINNAVLSGVTAVVAAGNSGSNPYTVGNPGGAALALTVGASDVPITIITSKGTLHAGKDSAAADLQLLAKGYDDDINALKGKDLPIVDIGHGDVSDYKGKDVKGKIALIERGNITLNEKIENAKKQGAAAVIIWNNNAEEGFIQAYLGEGKDFIPTFSVTNEQGKELVEKAAEDAATFSFDDMGQTKTEGDHLASFSSRGPVAGTYDIKPEVTAPGVSIMSTVPSYMQGEDNIGNYKNAYERLNGTSMATPHVAGIAALLKQADPTLTPADIKATIMNTADPLQEDYSVYEVGAGRVDPVEAIHSKLEIEVHDTTAMFDNQDQPIDIVNLTGALSLGSFVDYGKKYRETELLTLKNKSKTTQTYDVKVNYKQSLKESRNAKKNGVKLTTNATVKIGASNETETKVSLIIPRKAQKGVYEGYITFTNHKDPKDSYQVPFAFRYQAEGIKELQTTLPVMSDSERFEQYAPIQVKGTNVVFKLSAPMQRVDAFLADGNDGHELGYIAGADVSNNFEGYYMQMAPIFGYGKYYPFTGNSKMPISDDTVTAPPGHYKIKLVATGKSGKTFSKSVDIYIDNNKPKLNLDMQQSKVIEYKKGQKTYPLSGTILDPEMKAIQEAGIEMDSSKNDMTVYRYRNSIVPNQPELFPLAYIGVEKNGHFSWDIPLDQPVKQVRILGQDRAGNGLYSEAPIITFVERGTTYLQTTANKKTINYNETYHNTVSVKHARKWTGGTFRISYPTRYLGLVDIKPTKKLKKLGKVTITTEDSGKDALYSFITVSLKVKGKKINGDVPLLDVSLKAGEKAPIGSFLAGVRVLDATAVTKNKKEINVPSDAGQIVNIVPSYSTETFNLNPQAIKANTRDMGKSGTDIKVTDQSGKEFKGYFRAALTGSNTQNSFVVDHVPLTSKTLTIEAKIPGHTSAAKTVKIGREFHGKWIGTSFRTVDVRPSYAGDVNGDEVIDIRDAIAIEKYWGKNDRNADINFDGKVDMKDFAFVEQNFLFSNPEANNTPKPRKKFRGKTLQSIKKELE
ncbi:Fn3 domain-containing protein [Scopulibacillus darangshiensis]|uniref:Fn3 domain-containing protein n=1 Tax=Scopulibacillus darangshiensis TaxID=442528 RepID=A0A4R2PAS2_9BACL|nr:S8 family serine peptidase [Scopulibacillus darangshiensis]TCP30995.1 Fn3 domain-containing protein [Scopulibacillus darangshiensis]